MKTLTQLEARMILAEKVMGLKHEENCSGEDCRLPDPFTSAADSKALRDKLTQKWDMLLGWYNNLYGFALFRKNQVTWPEATFRIERVDEFSAICLCALEMALGERCEVTP